MIEEAVFYTVCALGLWLLGKAVHEWMFVFKSIFKRFKK